ncbi:hypothetical protein [Breoghania sp.]|nr:hypothetical protein [Breoghania sp.]
MANKSNKNHDPERNAMLMRLLLLKVTMFFIMPVVIGLIAIYFLV